MSDEGAPSIRIASEGIAWRRVRLGKRLGAAAFFLSWLPYVLTTIALEAGGRAGMITVLAALCMLLASPCLAIASLLARAKRRGRAGTVEVRDRELVITRGRRVRRVLLTELAQGTVSPLRRGVELRAKGGDVVDVRVAGADEGQRLLEAAGLDASRRATEIVLGETTFLDHVSWLGGLFVIAPLAVLFTRMLPGRNAELALPAVIVQGLVLFHRAVLAIFGPATIVLGADGLTVRGGFHERFVPHGRLERLHVTPDRMTIQLTDGSEIHARGRHLDDAQVKTFAARLGDARRAYERGGAGLAALARLDRGGRSFALWRDALRGVLERSDGYREGALTADDLARLVEAPSARAERRLGAAMALAASGDGDARARIRIAAEACASPRLRAALASTAADEIDAAAVEEAIAAERAAQSNG